MAHTFEIVKDKAGEFRVRFKYNSEVMFASEGYSSKAAITVTLGCDYGDTRNNPSIR